jgi:hypothetical protein
VEELERHLKGRDDKIDCLLIDLRGKDESIRQEQERVQELEELLQESSRQLAESSRGLKEWKSKLEESVQLHRQSSE